MNNLSADQINFLKQIQINTVAQQQSFVSREFGFDLMQQGCIQINNEVTDTQGNFLCWLTEGGATVANAAQGQSSNVPQMVQPQVDAKDPSAKRDEVTGQILPQPQPAQVQPQMGQQAAPQLPTFDPNAGQQQMPPLNPAVDQMVQAGQQPQFNPNQQQLPPQTVVNQPPVNTQPNEQPVGQSTPQTTAPVQNSTSVVVVSGITIPNGTPQQQTQKKKKKSQYPFESLQIGQSFFVSDEECPEGGKEKTKDAVRTMRSNANRENKANRVYKVDSIDSAGNRVYIPVMKKDKTPKLDGKGQQVYETIQTKRFAVYEWTVKESEVEALGNKYQAGTKGAMIFRVPLEPTDCHNVELNG